MPLDISFAQFDAISSGKYNAGQIDYKGEGSGASLKKVNAHVHSTDKNNVVVDTGHTVELKRAFVKAMSTRLNGNANALAEIRKTLGLPPDDSSPKALNQRTIEPLTRQEVRAIIDKYVNGGNARAVSADVAAKRDAVNVENQRRIPVQIGDQTFRLDEMASELSQAEKGSPKKSQAAFVLKILTRPDGRLDAAKFARAMNLFSFVAEQAANSPDAEKDAGGLLEAAFARALDSLDNGALSQVYQSLISREADDLKNELSRRLAKFNLTAEQAGVCERTATAMGRLEALVLNEIAHRIELGKAASDVDAAGVMSHAPVFRHCGANVKRDLSARGGAGEMTSVNLEVITSRAGFGNVHERNLAQKSSQTLRSQGFTAADAHDIGDMMRKSELTVNVYLSNLLGWRNGQDPNNPPLFQSGYSLVNTFVSKEQKGVAKDANGYLVRRNQVEKHFFPEYSKMPKFEGKDRPIYGAFNTMNKAGGAAESYGGVVLVMKNHVKQQATYTLNDTFFSLKYDFTIPNAKDKFLASAQQYFAKFVKPETLAALADSSTGVGKWLNDCFSLYAGSVGIGRGLETDGNIIRIAQELNENRVDPNREIVKDDIIAVLFDAIGVKDDDAGARVAGYDNIENLLSGLGEADPLLFGLSTVRRADNPNEPVRLAVGEYVEAQLHGPIVITRDVEEMRVADAEIEGHYREMAYRNPAVTEGKDVEAWIQEKTDADKAKLLKFGNDNGIKVSFYSGDDKNIDVANENLLADIHKAKEILHDEHSAMFRDIVDNDFQNVLRDAYLNFSYDNTAIAREIFGENLANLPKWLSDAAKAAAEEVARDIDNLNSDSAYSKEDIKGSIVDKVRYAIEFALDAIKAARAIGFDDAQKVLELAKDAVDAGKTGVRIMGYVTAKIVQERIAADPQALIRDTIANELSSRKEEIESLGVAGRFTLGGAALTRILAKVQEHLEKFHGGSLYECEKLISDIREKIVAPEIAKRLDLLKSIDLGSFANENVKNSFMGWVMNAKRIKSAEEIKGAKAAAESLFNAFSTMLANKSDFGAAAYMAALQDIALKIDAASLADSQANYTGIDAFGPDDRNGYINRAVSIGLGAIEAGMGRGALEKLARILSSHKLVELHTGLISASAAGNKADLFISISIGIVERLKQKYGLATSSGDIHKIDWSQISPNVRGLVSMADSRVVEALDAKFPFAPQTTKLMPPALNPAGAPKTLAERKRALFGALPAYRSHEKEFDVGRNTHGRGHATRVFVFANVLGNIMRERGVNVDLGSLSTSAAGHDMGRKGGGTDRWEKESGELVSQLAETVYPGVYGEDWKTQTKLSVSAGHGPEADAQRSVEGLLMKAADSLDYTRVAPLEEKRFHFLEKTLNVGGVNVMQDVGLRRALMHEAELLTKATSPIADKREQITRLKASDDPQKRAQGEAIEAEATKAEIAIAQLTDEEIVERIEKEIRDNPAKYPLLTKYYVDV